MEIKNKKNEAFLWSSNNSKLKSVKIQKWNEWEERRLNLVTNYKP
jgi:hypothetical protein